MHMVVKTPPPSAAPPADASAPSAAARTGPAAAGQPSGGPSSRPPAAAAASASAAGPSRAADPAAGGSGASSSSSSGTGGAHAPYGQEPDPNDFWYQNAVYPPPWAMPQVRRACILVNPCHSSRSRGLSQSCRAYVSVCRQATYCMPVLVHHAHGFHQPM